MPQACCHDHEHHAPPLADRLLRWAEAAVLIALAAFLVYAWATGRVRMFIAPMYTWLPPAAGGLLVLMAGARLWLRAEGCGCDAHVGRATRWLFTLGLAAPIALGLAVDPREFSREGIRKRLAPPVARDAAAERAMSWVLDRAAPGAPAGPAVDLPAEPTVLDLTQAGEQGQATAWAGRFVTVVGQCDTAEAADRFDLYRLVVTCCVADSQAVSLEVILPAGVTVEPRQWVRVGGLLRQEGAGRLVLQAATVAPIPMPAAPYL